MDDVISREAAIEYLMTNMGWHDDDGYEVEDADEKRAIITDLVNGISSVDAAPVVHARWDEIRDYTQAGLISFECSECGRLCDTLYKYCPRCGARMDGEADER